MPGRKVSPIVSKAQRGFFGAELARRKAGKRTRSGLSMHDLEKKLKDSKGKRLPNRKEKLEEMSTSEYIKHRRRQNK